ncbi:uncharacterized protein JCM15063_004114 [Sporobolomyces koalae]|uniref:uncharacterized protein n=1 Tax=Sporobolomyces koalae TaxID=500713 RepID=UPI00316AFE89
MSGIAPYHDAPRADPFPPPGCKVVAAASLIRHSSIYANDDEFEDYMSPFIQRVEAAKRNEVEIDQDSPLAFLNSWKSPINDDNLEDVTEPGKADAKELGKRSRELYKHLFPPKRLGKHRSQDERSHPQKKKVPPFKIWSASSSRDVTTSKEWIKGAFPWWQEGKNGEGDGTIISLVKVPNNDSNWANSLTPHKICPAFTKEAGKPEAQEWLEHYGPPILERLKGFAPDLHFELNDVIAMFMLCGYETVIYKSRESAFCSSDIFAPDDFRSFGYWNDIKYHHIVGYASPVAPYLGVGWLNTSTHNLLSVYSDPHPHSTSSLEDDDLTSKKKKKKPSLPPPSNPPDATHSQLFFPYVTHREEPPLAAVALGIWNTTHLPSDHMLKERLWKTSHLLPFLGHITLERLSCPVRPPATGDFVRVVINGAPQALPYCFDGPGQSCPMAEFEQHVKERVERYSDREGVCKKQDSFNE